MQIGSVCRRVARCKIQVNVVHSRRGPVVGCPKLRRKMRGAAIEASLKTLIAEPAQIIRRFRRARDRSRRDPSPDLQPRGHVPQGRDDNASVAPLSRTCGAQAKCRTSPQGRTQTCPERARQSFLSAEPAGFGRGRGSDPRSNEATISPPYSCFICVLFPHSDYTDAKGGATSSSGRRSARTPRTAAVAAPSNMSNPPNR
jgi:hypothetical protein